MSMGEIEVVDPDPNAAMRLHVVSIASAAQFCKERPPLRADYFRKMLRGDCDEHRGWMLRATVAGRWLRHIVTGEYVPVVGKVPHFIKTVVRNRPANDMPFHAESNALVKLLAGTYSNHGEQSNILHGWEKVAEPFDVVAKLNPSPTTTSPPTAPFLPAVPPPLEPLVPPTSMLPNFALPVVSPTAHPHPTMLPPTAPPSAAPPSAAPINAAPINAALINATTRSTRTTHDDRLLEAADSMDPIEPIELNFFNEDLFGDNTLSPFSSPAAEQACGAEIEPAAP